MDLGSGDELNKGVRVVGSGDAEAGGSSKVDDFI